MSTTEKNVYAESSEAPDQLEDLIGYIRSIRRFPKGFTALQLHFSVLDRLHQQPHHRRLIAQSFNNIVNAHEGKLFWTKNFDLFVVCKQCPEIKLEKAQMLAIRAVEEAEIMKNLIETGREASLCKTYKLSMDYDDFLETIEAMHRNKEQLDNPGNQPTLQTLMADIDKPIDQDKPEDKPAVIVEPKKKTVPLYEHVFPGHVDPPMGPMELDKLERNLQTMDMFNLIREQNVCVVMDGISPEVIYTKKFVSMSEVNESVLPGYQLAGDKWLFQRLTSTLDYRLMQALIDYSSFPAGVLSINMNVSNVLTKEFDKFISEQKKFSDKPMILEFSLFDIMSDLSEYYVAQKKIEQLGLKICICKMDIQSFYILDRSLMNVDFLKISWKKSYLHSLDTSERERIIQAIKEQGKMRVVLSECDTHDAIKYGSDLGIVMFQGFEVDRRQGI
ncbi:hypothetical protein [Pseudemcibacter aquimaris]|uniref:hypothetical protein n=1 Tax=Pseudemcibacter aquimaris TaxID=2857064 RepID=UPI002011D31E|nr:hypothetical protein [Pseudemcibacter aquimaris]MCC3861911.1 hypothetical protein [Pseudemcibacter aquimaris]WDU58663.1 hypothetical protein KW060_00055 [Pseudemcibacter aquimaris]